jgi:hypothetical protein
MTILTQQTSRSTLAFFLLFSFFTIQGSGSATGVEDTDTITVTAQVDQAPPACQDTQAPITFLPSLEYSSVADPVYIVLPDTTSDFATISTNIIDGTAADCTAITGYVTFSESGFKTVPDGDPVAFLTSVFECDNQTLTDTVGVYTCGQNGTGSPVIVMTVDANGSAEIGYYENDINIDLRANP